MHAGANTAIASSMPVVSPGASMPRPGRDAFDPFAPCRDISSVIAARRYRERSADDLHRLRREQ
ncbi:hypothetical protein LG3211_2073 [Lysobacter gummosus]|nr:hypothetical protein LG3211_2073 [Lysobacter gummosus]